MLFRKGKVWIPSDPSHRKLIMQSEHDSRVAGHMGMDKTMKLVDRNFYWPEMAKDIEHYVRRCEDCQKNKASLQKRHGALHPLELCYAPWDAISMDFITQLPKSDGCSTVWVIVDRFTKMAHFVPVKNGPKTAEGCAKLFLENIWKLHGLPSSIISDRDPVFTSRFWAELMERHNVRLRKSTAFHPQTDGFTERVNQSVEEYLRQYCNYEQDNGYDLLPLVEYVYNNSATTAAQMRPFFANYGFRPRTNWPVEKESKHPVSRNYVHWTDSEHELCVKRLEESRERMGKYYDCSRKEAPPYLVGDLVMLNGKNIRTQRAVKKLDAKLFGPFKVVRLVGQGGQSVELELPQLWRVHNVFHTSLIEPYRISVRGLRVEPIAVTDSEYVDRLGVTHEVGYDVEGNQVLEDFEVEEILGSHYNAERKKVLYLIIWKGYLEES